MRKMTGLALAAVAAVGVVSAPAASRAAIMVDDFASKNAGVWPMSTTASMVGGMGNTENGLAGVLGGYREETLLNTTMDVPGYDTFRADVFNGSGFSFLDVSSSSGAKGSLQLNYGTVNGPAFNLGHTADTDAVRITFLAVDLANGGPLRIDVEAWDGNVGTPLPPVYVTGAGAQSVDVPLDLFWKYDNKLDGLQVAIGGATGTDYRIDSISLVSVPEPASVAGLAVAAGAVAMRRRRA